jgi:hypothetical protein
MVLGLRIITDGAAMKRLTYSLLVPFILWLSSLTALNAQNYESFKTEVRSASLVVVASVTKTIVSEGDGGEITSAIQIGQCEILGSRLTELVKNDRYASWKEIIDEINHRDLSVELTSLSFDDDASFPVKLGKRYLFFLSIPSSGGLVNQNTLIPAVPWSPAAKKAVLACKELNTSELKNGKVCVEIKEYDPFTGKPFPKK